MHRNLIGLSVALLASSVATAEPLPWAYSVYFKAAGTNDAVLLGSENWQAGPDAPAALWYATLATNGPGIRATGPESEMGRTTLFGFSNGDWTLSELPPSVETTSLNAFDLIWSFTAANGETASGNERGSISAGGFFTSGTGNFNINLDLTREVMLNGKRAAVRFAASNSESVSRIEMTVDPVPVAETPEPATLLLAGAGLSGVALRRSRRR